MSSAPFDSIVDDAKERITRGKHLRVENLVKIQSRLCKTCDRAVVWCVVNNAGKRLPFDPGAVLGNSLKVVIGPDESLEVWNFSPKAHKCPTVYTSLRKLLTEHPDLRPLHEARGRAALARNFQSSKLDEAKAEWDKALAERNILLESVYRGVGFADQEGPNPLTNVWGDRA